MKKIKNMKSVVITMLLAVLAMGCQDRLTFLDDENEAPVFEVQITEDGKVVLVSEVNIKLKTSQKHGSDRHTFDLQFSDYEEGKMTLSSAVVSGDATVLVNDVALEGDMDVSELENLSVDIVANENNLISVDFTIADEIGKSGAVTVNIDAFDNMFPVAGFTFDKIALHSAQQYEFDGSSSYDEDAEYGGGVSYYEWSIDGRTFVTQEPTFRQDLTPGGYDVGLVVIDNDGGRSEEYSEIVQIN